MKRCVLLLSVVCCFISIAYAQVPTIASFTPLSGPVGTTVTITGTNFSTTPANNIVYVGGMKAVVNAPSTTNTLTITIPPGITFGPMSVTVGGLTAYSLQNYLTTFEGGGVPLVSSSFGPSATFDAPFNYIISTAMGDLNNDGKADVVTANYTSNTGTTISVFTNNSGQEISFSDSRLDITTGNGPFAVVLFDVDGDGKLDVAVNNYGGGKISVLRNTSSGGVISFDPKVDISMGTTGSTSLVIADFDRDGKPDIAYPDFSAANTISVLRNTTIGTSISFTKTSYTAGNLTYYISSGDYDGDGKIDIAMINSDDSSPTASYLGILRNTSPGSGTISFAPKIDLPTLVKPQSIASGDLDGDGKTDIGIGYNFQSTAISVFRNTSTAGTLQFATKMDVEVNYSSTNLSFNDIDGDGKIDILLAQGAPGVLHNKSTAGALAFDTHMLLQSTNSGVTVNSGDLNNDGRPDLLSTNAGSGITVNKNKINEPFIESFSPIRAGTGDIITVIGTNLDKVTAANIAGATATFTITSPTQLQVTVGNGASGSVNLVSPYGTGTKSGFTFYNGPLITEVGSNNAGSVGFPITIRGGHFSATAGDNIVRFGTTLAEVVAASPTELSVKIPNGSMYQPVTVTVNKLIAYSTPFEVSNRAVLSTNITSASFAPKQDFQLATNPETFAIGDFDDDGKPDVAVIQSNTIAVFRNTGTPGTFSFDAKIDLVTGSLPISIAAADFDNDGKLDIAVANSGSASVSVFKNTSSGAGISFETKTDFTVGTNPQFIATGDLNGDGKTDIATANFTSSNFASVLLNTTTTTISFGAKTDYTAGSFPTSVAIADMNGDKRPELLVTNGVANTLTVFRNTSNEAALTFDTPQNYPTGSFPVGIALSNYTNIVNPNVLVVNSTASSVSTYNGYGGGLTVNADPIPTGGSPAMIAMGDLNGDYAIDFASANNSASSVSVFQNTGQISFASKVDLTTGGGPNAIAVVDLDGDGSKDIITTNNSASSFSILRNLTPAIAYFSPQAAPAGATVTIMGSNLSGATGVTFGSTPATSFKVVSSTTIEAVVGRGTTGRVEVILPSGTLSLSGFTYEVFDPTLQSFTPAKATTGTVVTLTGINMNSVASVSFGGTLAASFEILSPTSISAVVGTGSSGLVVVSAINGHTSSNSGFVYVTPPSITSFSPTTASTGRTVIITGTNFSGVTAVSFGDVPATSFKMDSPTTLSAVVGSGATGKVTLTFSLGTVSLDGFTYETVTAIEPDAVSDFDVFPNPNNGQTFNLRLPSSWDGENALVEIRDLTGRSLTHQQIVCQREAAISIAEPNLLHAGVYIVNVRAGNKKLFKKVIVKN